MTSYYVTFVKQNSASFAMKFTIMVLDVVDLILALVEYTQEK